MKTKEQLSSENAKLEKSVQDWAQSDLSIRKDFSKVLGQFNRDYGYSNQTPKDLSWREIFCEVGKLLRNHDLSLINSRIAALEDKVYEKISASDLVAK